MSGVYFRNNINCIMSAVYFRNNINCIVSAVYFRNNINCIITAIYFLSGPDDGFIQPKHVTTMKKHKSCLT